MRLMARCGARVEISDPSYKRGIVALNNAERCGYDVKQMWTVDLWTKEH